MKKICHLMTTVCSVYDRSILIRFAHVFAFTEELLDSETVDAIVEGLSDVMNDVITKYNVTYQVNDAYDKLKNEITSSKGKYLLPPNRVSASPMICTIMFEIPYSGI